MTYSLNEADVTAKKAARGAGYSWGLAEEAGKAVRWLCAQGLDGCAEMAGLLQLVDCDGLSDFTPRKGETDWQATGQMLCPLLAGAALSDRAAELGQGDFRTGSIAQPLLLLPFASNVAMQRNCTVKVDWDGAQAILDGVSLHFQGDAAASATCVSVQVDTGNVPGSEKFSRADPRAEDWKILNQFAHRTYAPATEESRLKGAGAEMNAND